MPFVHGRNTQVLLDEKDVSAFLNMADLNVDVEPGETTTFTRTWKTFIPGLANSTLETKGYYDPLFEDMRQAIQVTPDSIVSYAPGGVAAVGDPVRLAAHVTATYKESSPVGGVVAFNWNVASTDTLGIGEAYHVLGAETTTANGTAYPPSGGVQTLFGAVAHLHITAVSGGSPTLTVKFQDSTSFGGEYSDISGGSFTVASVIGAQRLVIAGTIRAYVRAVWTITGSTPSFTFATSLARKTA